MAGSETPESPRPEDEETRSLSPSGQPAGSVPSGSRPSGAGNAASGEGPTAKIPSSLQKEFFPAERADRLNCPHCGNAIQVVGPVAEDVTCASCGSTFQVASGNDATTLDSLPVSWIGRFEAVSLLGRGGFGVVYKARDPELKRLVAIKVPRAGYLATVDERERFVREARHAAQLQHPGIVRVYEVAAENSVPYIVSELIEGLTLADLAASRRLSHREAAELMVQTAEALEYAHSRRVIHRDIKPSNILLDHDLRPHLADFGLARWDDAEITITRQGEVLGTPSYMSPEQAAGDVSRIDVRTDVYSLGVVLYRLLTGELPFRGSRRMLIHQLLHEDPRPLRRINETVPRDLETITLRAMAKDPAKRFPSAQAFADDLRRWLRQEPITSRPVGRIERTVRWCKRHPLPAALLAMIGLLLLVTCGVSLGWAIREREHAAGLQTAWQKEAAERTRADRQATEARRRLAHHLESEGVAALRRDEPLSSLPWFVEALKLRDPGSTSERLDRLRLGMIASYAPRLDWSWSSPQEIRTAVVSPDGRWIGVGGRFGEVYAISTDGTSIRSSPQPHRLAALKLAFSPDGSRLASASDDGTARIWSFRDQPSQVQIVTCEDWVRDVAFHPQGNHLAIAAHKDMVRLVNLDAPTAAPTMIRLRGWAHRVVFAPDGGRLACIFNDAEKNDHCVVMWDWAGNKTVGDPFTAPAFNTHAEFTADGSKLICVAANAIHVLDANTGREQHKLDWPAPIRDFVLNADRSLFAIADETGRARIFDTSQYAAVGRDFRHPSPLSRVAFSQDSQFLALAGVDGITQVWSRNAELPWTPRLRQSQWICGIAFLERDQRLLTACADGGLQLWAFPTPEMDQVKPAHQDSILRILTTADGERFVTCGRDGIARIWDTRRVVELSALIHTDPVIYAHLGGPNSSLLATGCTNHTVRIWRLSDGTPLTNPIQHPAAVTGVRVHPDGKHLATSCEDGVVRIWEIATSTQVRAMTHDDIVRSLEFDGTGEFLASCSEDRTARVWQFKDGEPAAPSLPHARGVTSLSMSPDGKWLATADRTGAIRLWDWRTGKQPWGPLQHQGEARRARFSPTGNRLLTVGYNDLVYSLDLHDGTVQAMSLLVDNANWLTGRFADDSLVVLMGDRSGIPSSSTDLGSGIAALFDPVSGFPLSPPLRHRHNVSDGFITGDRKRLITGTAGGELRVWPITPELRSGKELEQWSEAASGLRLDQRSNLVPVPFEARQYRGP